MKFIRYAKGKTEYRGILDEDIIKRVNGTLFHDYSVTNEREYLKDVKVLPPVLPSKILGIRKNYGEKTQDMKEPQIFMKPPASITASGENIIIPHQVSSVRAEGELAVIIGKKCAFAEEKRVSDYIFGFTIANDVTLPFDAPDKTVTIGKFFDTFTPIGPVINTDTDYGALTIKTYKNGEEVQNGITKDMIFGIPAIISYLSSITTLLPGDVILTGTPLPAVEIQDGDIIEISIDGIGRLINNVTRKEK